MTLTILAIMALIILAAFLVTVFWDEVRRFVYVLLEAIRMIWPKE